MSSGSALPGDTPAPTQSPARAWPTLAGLAGGWITLDGEVLGREGPESKSALLAALDEPDEEVEALTCGRQPLKNTTYRWGDFSVIVLNEVEPENDYGGTYPPGSIAGWRVDPTMDGLPGLVPNATGPEGTAIGTPLDALSARFETDDWDYAGVEGDAGSRVFSIFVGDTTGAVFELDGRDRVSAMWAGYQCSQPR